MSANYLGLSPIYNSNEKPDYNQLLETKFNERYESLKSLMEVKLETLYDSVEKALEKVFFFLSSIKIRFYKMSLSR